MGIAQRNAPQAIVIEAYHIATVNTVNLKARLLCGYLKKPYWLPKV